MRVITLSRWCTDEFKMFRMGQRQFVFYKIEFFQ
jgi:hypothetical protein